MEMKEEKSEGNYILWFSKLNQDLFSSVGEKGANLGELYNNNFPVPNGFVVTIEGYVSFLESSGLKDKIKGLLNQIDLEKNEQVENVCKKIKSLIMKSEFSEEMKEEILESYENLGTNKLEIEKGSAYDILNNANEPIFVSVRASLLRPEFENSLREQSAYLNVKGNSNLLAHVKSCFASLFNPETIKRELKSLGPEDLKIAVVVQRMIESEKSGVIYSRDSQENIVINSIWGLGEGMNLKEISQDRYVLSRELDLLNKKIENKEFMVIRDSAGDLQKRKTSDERKVASVLNKYEMQRLGDFAQKIEKHFKKPQKIEFGIEAGEIYLLQSRELKKLIFSEVKEEVEDKEVQEVNLVKEDKKSMEDKLEIIPVKKITKTKLKLVLDSPALADGAMKIGLKKVGILKIEKIIKENGKHPFYFLDSNYLSEYENLIYDEIKKVKNSFEEIWIRTSNFELFEFNKLEGSRNLIEKNPFLGLRGIRFGLKYLDLLESELNAAKRISGDSEIGILIPNIISIEELKQVKKHVDPSLKIGVVIETPAAIQLIKEFCEEVDYVLIDGDNLLQNLLGLDKTNPNVKELFDETHPAFLYQLEYMIRVCKRKEVSVSIFGDVLKNDKILKYLVEKGIDFICVEPDKAGKISEKISEIEEKVVKGTDKEPRQYELAKEKKEYLSEPESSKEDKKEKVEEEVKKLVPVVGEDLEKDLKLIEEEKKEYLGDSGKEEVNGEKKSEKIEGKENEELKESKEKFDEEKPEIIEEDEKEELVEEEFVEENIIGETKDSGEEKKDTLGLFN